MFTSLLQTIQHLYTFLFIKQQLYLNRDIKFGKSILQTSNKNHANERNDEFLSLN